MRIAIVTETFLPRVNGIVRMLLEYLDYLEARGHQAIIFAPGQGESYYRGFEVVRVTGVPFPLYPEVILAPYSTRMGRKLQSWRPDIVHLASPFVLGMHGLNVARTLGVPIAAHYQTDIARYAEHFGLGTFANLVWRRLLDIHNNCTVNFAPTPSVAQELRQRGVRQVEVCGRGVDAQLFHPRRRNQALRARLLQGCDRPIFLYVGRLSPEKNLEILEALASTLPDFPLLIVGDGPARATLEAKLAEYNVQFTGLLHGEELATAYASADIFLFPSATETFGQVVREAMASGLPVIGARAGGVQDLIRDGETGVLCAPESGVEFVTAARRLVEHNALRQALSTAARAEAELHTWEAIFNRLTGWYGVVSSQQFSTTVLSS